MSDQQVFKHCKGCDKTQTLDNFYRAGEYYQALCKPCHNGKRYVKKGRKHPFERYTDEQREILNEYFPKRKSDKLIITMRKLSELTGIPINTLQGWRKRYDNI